MMTRLLAFAAILSIGSAFAEQPDKWVSYVEATGSQWVDTGIIGRWNTKAECKVEWMALADSAFLASRDGAWQHPTKPDGKMYFCYCLDTNGVMYTAQDVSEAVNWYRDSVTWWPRFEKNRVYNYTAEYTATNGEGNATNIIKVDGQQTDNITRTGFDSGLNLYIFANNQTNKATACSKARCYGLKIWQGPKDGGDMVLVRDFQPCVKDNRAGLYDSVSDTIFYSDSGADLVCDENSEVPDEFIEYVESQGEAELADGQLSAYIDTGIIGRSGTKMSGEFAILRHEDKGFLGSRDNTKSESLARFYLLQSYNSKITCGYGSHKSNDYTLELGKKYWVETELNAGSQIERIGADGVTNTVHSGSVSTAIDTGCSMYLFTCNINGSPTWFAKARCYGFKIWQDNTLVRDYHPCLKNGVAGLYDAVSSNIFYSLGTPFVFDNRRKAPKKKEIAFVEYIESDGWNTLDTGVPARSGLRAAGDMMWTEPKSDDNGTTMRSWKHDSFRYMEGTAAAPVLWRQQHAYLSAVKPSTGERFYMVHAFDAKLDMAHGIHKDSSGDVHIYLGGNGANITPAVGEKYSFDVTLKDGEQTFDWNGERALATNFTGNVDTGTSLYLFSSSYWRHRSAARCYGLTIWDGDTLVRDFKPCLVDGKGMLYDEVTQMLYRPSPDIPASRTGKVVLSGAEKPAQYVEYVESNGKIFVDTGVIGKSGTKAELDVAFLANEDKGCLDSRSGGNRFYLFHNGSTSYGILYGYGGYVKIGNPSVGTRYHVESSLFTGSQLVWINGELKGNGNSSTAYDTNLSMYLFACHQDGSPTYPGSYRFYSLKLWQGDADGSNLQLLRDFKPVKLSNGVVVLWDFQNDVPYLPQSTTAPYAEAEFSAVGPDGEFIYEGTRISIR